MGVLETISRLVGGVNRAKGDATAALSNCYSACLQRTQELQRHAEVAPQAHSAEALRYLATAEQAQAERLREALQAAGARLPIVEANPGPGHSTNHWGRLVQDLDLHRRSFRDLRELAVRFAESLPATAQLLDELCNQELTHCEQLRELIARADPQALD